MAEPYRFTQTIAVEGKETTDGRLLLPGALTWERLPVAVTGESETPLSYDLPLLGKLVDVRRLEGGLIEGHFELEKPLAPGQYAMSIAVTFDEEDVDETSASRLAVTSARLLQVMIKSAETAVWPEIVFEVPHE